MSEKQRQAYETRKCPGCGQVKSFPTRNIVCGADCRAINGSSKALLPDRSVAPPRETIALSPEAEVLELLQSTKNLSLAELCNRLDRSPATIEAALAALKDKGYNIAIAGEALGLSDDFTYMAPRPTDRVIVHPLAEFSNLPRLIGACGDNHLGSNHERLDVLNALYDIYESEGVKDVFNTGNWIEGVSRLNKHDIKVHGFGDQIDYFVQNYPSRPGITTHFVAGDDHEGWLQKAERVEVGRYAEAEALRAGRTDLHYLGYVEADVVFRASGGERLMKVIHPGGGSSYATSYAPQKLIESFQGGEKPEILLLGHYHKFDHGHYRGVHYVQTGCTVDQSIFMRKQKLSAAVGGCLIEFNQASDGAINRFKVEWIPFYNRGYYGLPRQFGLTDSPENLVR